MKGSLQNAVVADKANRSFISQLFKDILFN